MSAKKTMSGSGSGKQAPPAPKLTPPASGQAGPFLTPFTGRVTFGKGK